MMVRRRVLSALGASKLVDLACEGSQTVPLLRFIREQVFPTDPCHLPPETLTTILATSGLTTLGVYKITRISRKLHTILGIANAGMLALLVLNHFDIEPPKLRKKI